MNFELAIHISFVSLAVFNVLFAVTWAFLCAASACEKFVL